MMAGRSLFASNAALCSGAKRIRYELAAIMPLIAYSNRGRLDLSTPNLPLMSTKKFDFLQRKIPA